MEPVKVLIVILLSSVFVVSITQSTVFNPRDLYTFVQHFK